MKNKLFLAIFICLNAIQSQSLDPLITADAKAQEKWVDSIVNNMTIEEKIGQLFMIQAYSNKDKKHEKFITDLIQNYHIGNLIFMQGTPKKQAILTNKYQALSKIPLMIGFDGEWGLDMRLKNTFRYPWNMTLGAIRNNDLIEKFGKQLGKHCKRLGIHINFAPVVDINTNPDNPIIGNRSFGENKKNVTQKAMAFTRGMQSENVLASAKHFPGHGDTSSDSHYILPVINFDKKRLDKVELYPYKKLFSKGLASVMTAHLSVPSLESNKKLPSSLSKKIVTDLLVDKLGFLGLIITDGLNMKGAANYSTSSEIDLAAILAGNDLLLIPQDVPATVALFKKSIENKTLTIRRLDHSVRKILKAKYWAGLHNYSPIDLNNLHKDLNSTADVVLHRKLVEKSITVLKNDKNIIPIQNLDKNKIAYVKIGKKENTSFVKMLKNYTKVDVVSGDNLPDLIKKLKPYNLVVIGYHTSNANPWKGFKFKSEDLLKIQKIARNKKVILDVFASPYSLSDIKRFTNIEGLIVSYQNSKIAQEISAQQIFGALRMEGKLSVTINKSFREGYGLSTSSLSRLQYGIPEEVDLSFSKLSKIDSIASLVIEQEMSPGLQVLVARYGKVVYHKSFGHHTYNEKRKVKLTDMYDLASLTKILGGLPMIMKSEENGFLNLNTKLSEILPYLKDSNKGTITIKEALSHNAKIIPWIPYYIETIDSITKKPLKELYRAKKTEKYSIKVAENLYLIDSYTDSIYKRIADVPQLKKEGYVYSGLIFYLFKKYLKNKYNKEMDKLNNHYFYKPIGANTLTYNPLNTFNASKIVPSEVDNYYRHQTLQGYVHDMGAGMMSGVSGNAGLFSNSNDIAKMMQMYLQKGFYGGKRFFKAETIHKFNKRYYEDNGVRRGLGFDKPQLDPNVEATCGCVSDRSFGHSGFTGTYAWADPESGILYVFLSNRTYPTMENRALMTEDIRTKIQQIIQDAILVK